MPPPLANPGIQMSNIPAPLPTIGEATPKIEGAAAVPRSGRIRVNRACVRCRSHKIKCTGSFPCANCTKNHEECRFGKEEAVKLRRTRSPEYATGASDTYTEYLESRVRYLESLLRRLMEEKCYDEGEYKRVRREAAGESLGPGKKGANTDNGNDFLARQVSFTDLYDRVRCDREYRDSEEAMRRSEQAAQKADAEADPQGDRATAQGATSKAADLPPPRSDTRTSASVKWRMVDRPVLSLVTELCNTVYSGLSETAKAHVTVPRRQFFGWNMSGCHYLQLEQLPPEPDMSALSDDQRSAYVNYFFREINPLFAILHETVFREQIRASAADDSTTNFTVLFRAMLCLVYALSIRFTEFVRPRGPSLAMLQLEESLFRYAHRVVLIFSFEWELFELIQCWLLVTLYLRTTHRQTSAFTALSRAVHMCRVMGLGRPPRLPQVPQYEALKARRIFECVYCFDRVLGYFGGRRRSFPEVDISRRLPLLDFEAESERDDWITLPAFAMIHIGRVANLIPLGCRSDVRIGMIERELVTLDAWLTANGFGPADTIFSASTFPDTTFPQSSYSSILPIVRAQVRLHFYDLVLSVHGPVLFSLLGHPGPTAGMQLERVRRANADIVRLAQGLSALGLLYVPWYTTLNLVFNAGICSLVLLQASVAVHEARGVLAGAMGILQQLQELPVYEDDKMLFFERFKMVRECMWALKTANHIVSLGFTEAAQGLRDLGIDHGNPDVNKQYFGQFGLVDAPGESRLDRLAEDQSQRGFQDRQKVAALISAAPESAFSQPNLLGDNGIIESLRWFDNWLDFGDGP